MSKFLDVFNYQDFLTLYNPFFLKDMSKAIERVIKAINDREKIVIYGSCNTDSICGVSLLFLLFKYLNADVEYYIPDHYTVNLESDVIKNHIRFLGAKLIVTVGSDLESNDDAELCKSLGIDVLVLNNEEMAGSHKYITVNPKQEDCLYKFKDLAASGVAYKFAQAISMYYDITCVVKYVDLVMLGVIASGKPIEGENLIFVNEGVRYLKQSKNYGIKALIKVHDTREVNDEQLDKMVQTVKPTINARGRMDNAKIAVELFTTKDGYRAEQIAKYLNNEVINACS